MKYSTKKRLATPALLLAAFAWGSAFLVLKDAVSAFNPVWLLAFRFLAAAVILLVLCIPMLKKMTKKTIVHGIFMGVILYFEFLFFVVGIQYTTGSKGSFISASYIIILPLVYFLIRRKKPKPSEIVASIICVFGLAFILLGSFDAVNQGDMIISLSALCYAVHIVVTGVYAKEDNPVLLNLMQIVAGAVVAFLAALCFGGKLSAEITFGDYGAVLYLAVFCTILPYLLSVFGQKYLKTSTSGILLSFESVFGCLCSVLVYGDKITVRFLVGAVLIIAAFLVCNHDPEKSRKNSIVHEKTTKIEEGTES